MSTTPNQRTGSGPHSAPVSHADPVAPLTLSPVHIIGTGLIGGSLGLALTAAGAEVFIHDSSPGTAALAAELGVGKPADGSSPQPDLVIVAVPPDSVATVVAQALHRWPHAIVTDVASVKATIANELAARVQPTQLSRYIGAHPMAGREIAGVIAAQGDLFRGRPFAIVPHETTEPRAIAMLRALATDIGALPMTFDADAHDLAVAQISHLPQILASTLGASLLDADASALTLSGQGLRDTARLADSDPRLWVEILGANAGALTHVLDHVHDRLSEVRSALGALAEPSAPEPERGARRALAALIADGNAGARRIPGKHGGAREDFLAFTVLVPDQPGELARMLTAIGEAGVNLEDLRLEHVVGVNVGLAHLSVEAGDGPHLRAVLDAGGWTIAAS